jgi:hypothetical protein
MTPPSPIPRIADLCPHLPEIGFRALGHRAVLLGQDSSDGRDGRGHDTLQRQEAPAKEMIFDNHPFYGTLLHVSAATLPSATIL